MKKTDNNPLRIPDLNPMYDAVVAYVRKHQGEKGFIFTDDPNRDSIYSIEYSGRSDTANEFHVKAVRVDRFGRLQILSDAWNARYDEKTITEKCANMWNDVRFDEVIYYVPTLFNIAENIRMYVKES